MEEKVQFNISQEASLLGQVGEYLEIGVLTLDQNLTVRGWNHWLEAASGIAERDAAGRSILDIFPTLKGTYTETSLREGLQGRTVVMAHRFHNYLLPLPAPAGFQQYSHMQQSARIAPIENFGRTIGVVVLITDVTERVAGEDELRQARDVAEQASRAKSEFLASMSHELRTPLTAIIGFADLLEYEVGGQLSDVHKQHVRRVKAGAWHLIGIIDEILTFSRLEANRLELVAERLDAVDLARETAAFLEPAAHAKKLQFRVDLPEQEIRITADPLRLRQVLINLIGNAIKFTDNGWVELAVRVEDERVAFYVRDSGPGIAAEHQQRVFEPFRQVEQSNTRNKGGTGLGLSVSRDLARLMQGDLYVESTSSAGSTFVLWLPVTAGTPGTSGTSGTSGTAGTPVSGRI